MPWLHSQPPGVDWHAPIDTTPLPARFKATAARFATHPCLEFLGKSWTYAEVEALVDRAAKGLRELGVGPGTRFGLYLPNTPYYVVLYYAALATGATVVNFNPLYAREEVLWQIQDSGTTILATLDVDVLWSKVAPAIQDGRLKKVVLCRMSGVLPFPKNVLFPIFKHRDLARVERSASVIAFERLVANDGRCEPVTIDPASPALFQYTGGTTGVPKAAVLSHRAIAANASQVRMLMPTLATGAERFLGVLPLCHVFAMTAVMNIAMTTGSEIILLPRFDLEQLLATCVRLKPTIFPGVPAIYGAINHHKRVDRFDLRSLKFCISGGAPLPVEVKRRFEMLTGCQLVEGYGLSEASPVATCNPLYGAGKEGSIGIPLPGTKVEIRSLDDPRVPVPLGEQGEVCVQGPQLMDGYWQKPEESAHVLFDGWLRTGDVARMDEDGYVFVVDRIKDVIFRGGYNVYPRMIEEAIYAHADVAEACVVGVDDDVKGQVPKAFVRLRDGATLDAESLRAFLVDRLSKVEMPRDIEFRTEPLPKTRIGKPSKLMLKQEESARVARKIDKTA
ncbi:MAG: long-chain fatty acid--CoA ligase [Planctomycetes bacterium]|nr:long-chain fatty acid--CoA ligase [Planctomycetota bacterium]